MNQQIKEKFNQIAKRIANEFGVVIHLAEINGKRWSYIGGDDVPEDLAFDTHCLKVSDSVGTIVYGWSKLGAKKEEALLDYCRQELT